MLPKWFIHFRLSDPDGRTMSHATRRYYNKFSDADKRSNDLYQLYKHINISVGDTGCVFETYSQALEFIREYLNKLQLEDPQV